VSAPYYRNCQKSQEACFVIMKINNPEAVKETMGAPNADFRAGKPGHQLMDLGMS